MREPTVKELMKRAAEPVLRSVPERRTGTVVLDLVAFGGLNAEYPDYGFVIVDNDLGRFVLYAAPSEGWLMFGGMDRRALAGWLHEAVDSSRT